MLFVIRTSSSRDGKIFRVFNPSENRSRTPLRPFIKAIFSSRGFDANVERSRKLSVEIANDENTEADDRVAGEGRGVGCRVISDFNRAGNSSARFHRREEQDNDLADRDRASPSQQEVSLHCPAGFANSHDS